MKKGFKESIQTIAPDILCIQETKAHPSQVDALLHDFPHHFWHSAQKKGYSGTAIFSKIEPLSVIYSEQELNDNEGRVITAEFQDFFLVNVYTPNSKRGLLRLEERQQWDKDFLTYLKKLESSKPVIVCGDMNVAHTQIDLANPKPNYNKNAGFTQAEIDGFENYLAAGFIDTFREFNKEPKNYTWWSYMFNARARNIGWRIDYFLISKALRPRLQEANIHPAIMGSDHCPVSVNLK